MPLQRNHFLIMCVSIFPVNPTTYRSSHGSHTQKANLSTDISAPVRLWLLFINFLYINKVCDVCDGPHSPMRKGSRSHSFAVSIVRYACTWVKPTLPLHEVERLLILSLPLRGLLQCKYLSNTRHATSIF